MEATRRLVGAAGLSSAAMTAVIATGLASDTRLGAPLFWPWLLTGLQVLSLWSAGRERWWGWLMGASVQLPWIAYAVMTGQLGFIPGCAISCGVQLASYLRRQTAEEGAPDTIAAPIPRIDRPEMAA